MHKGLTLGMPFSFSGQTPLQMLLFKSPFNVTLGAFLSSGLQLKSQVDKNLKLIVPECYATPTSNRYDMHNYSLFSDKYVIYLKIS